MVKLCLHGLSLVYRSGKPADIGNCFPIDFEPNVFPIML